MKTTTTTDDDTTKADRTEEEEAAIMIVDTEERHNQNDLVGVGVGVGVGVEEGVLKLLFQDEEDEDEKNDARAAGVGFGVIASSTNAPRVAKQVVKNDTLHEKSEEAIPGHSKEDHDRMLSVVRACGLDTSDSEHTAEGTDTEPKNEEEEATNTSTRLSRLKATTVPLPLSSRPSTGSEESDGPQDGEDESHPYELPIHFHPGPGAYDAAPGQDPVRLPFLSSAGALLLQHNTETGTGHNEGVEESIAVSRVDDSGVEDIGNPASDAVSIGVHTPPQDDHGGLVQANLIPADEEVANLPVAEPHDHLEEERQSAIIQQQHEKRKLAFRMGGGIAAVMGVVAIVLALVFTLGSSTFNESKSSSTTSNEYHGDNELAILGLLPESIQRKIQNDQDDETYDRNPPRQAFQWLLDDPSLETYQDWRKVQRFALAAFYLATGGNSTWRKNDQWLEYDVHECEWWSRPSLGGDMDSQSELNQDVSHLVEHYKPSLGGSIISHCDAEGQFWHLWLWRNGLRAKQLPLESVSLLTSLKTISLYLNDFDGATLPSQLAALTNLEGLVLNNMGLTGPLPTGLGHLTKLETLIVLNNQLSGSLPTELGDMSEFQFFMAHSNQLTGPLPSQLGRLTKLSTMIMFGNLFSSSLPTELGLLQHLMQMQIYRNQLSGPIPSELGGGLSSLLELELDTNQLIGTVPSELGLLTQMTFLSLHTNPTLVGTIPTELGNLDKTLEVLTLRGCELSGSIPSQLGRLTKLTGLWLFDNALTSSIPSELGQLGVALKILDLSYNHLNGTIPASLGLLTRLEELLLEHNSLTGPVPSELGEMNSLKVAYLQTNVLSGSIPDGVVWPPLLHALGVSNNTFLSGVVPNDLCELDTSNCQEKPDMGYFCGVTFDCDSNNLCGCNCPCA